MPVPRIPGSGAYARAFPTGTLMLFQQTAAPTGWTKQTTHNDKALRVVSGTASSGGATAFTSVFNAAGGSTTLTTSHLPASGLSIPALTIPALTVNINNSDTTTGGGGIAGAAAANNATLASATVASSTGTGTTGNMGTGGGHTHVTPDIHYVDVIIASKQ